MVQGLVARIVFPWRNVIVMMALCRFGSSVPEAMSTSLFRRLAIDVNRAADDHISPISALISSLSVCVIIG
jgi:hypothetical protein